MLFDSSLVSIGFSQFFSSQLAGFEADVALEPARVIADHRGQLTVLGASVPTATLSGRLRHELAPHELPVTSDWVALEPRGERGVVHRVFERSSVLRRKSAGTTSSFQVIAANVDVFFVVTTATDELNARRLERFVSAIYSGGALPVVVLNKVDLVDDPEPMLQTIRAISRDLVAIAVSARAQRGLEALAPWLEPSRTVGFVGSSGVGKSSLINALLQRGAQVTHAVDQDNMGRHTTTGRSLHALEGGAWLMDTPGMREFGAADDGEGISRVFSEIDEIAQRCRYRDCTHEREPGCAVQGAVREGSLDPARLESLHKLEREAKASAARHDHAIAAERKRVFKERSRSLRSMERARRRNGE